MKNGLGQEKNINYDFVDVMKFLMVIFVIILHAGPISNLLEQNGVVIEGFMPIDAILRVPVPFFFIVAGFFLYRKMGETILDFKRIKKYLGRIFKLYCVWYIIYIPWIIGIARHSEQGFILGFLYQILLFFTSGYFHLWFLNALMVAVALVSYLLYKKISIYKIIGIAGIFYAAVLLNAPYYGVFEVIFPPGGIGFSIVQFLAKIFVTSRNGWMEGFFFVAIGSGLAFKWRYLSIKWVMLGIISSAILLFVEIYFVDFVAQCSFGGADCYIFLVPLSVFIVILAIEIELPASLYWIWMRKMSMLMYYSHVLWLNSLRYLNTYCNWGLGSLHVLLLTIFGTLLLSAFIIKYREKPVFSWLKILG